MIGVYPSKMLTKQKHFDRSFQWGIFYLISITTHSVSPTENKLFQMTVRPVKHTTMFVNPCQIQDCDWSRAISVHSLCDLLLYSFHVGTGNSLPWPSNTISIPSCTSHFSYLYHIPNPETISWSQVIKCLLFQERQTAVLTHQICEMTFYQSPRYAQPWQQTYSST